MILSNVAVKRPVFITMIMMAITVFGIIGLKEVGVDLFPKVEFPIVAIMSSLPGSDPETIERTVSEPIEEAVSSISSIKNIISTSSEGFSQVVVEFELEKNVDVAFQEIQAKLGTIRSQLPDDLKNIVTEKFDVDASPIMAVIVSGSKSLQEVSRLSDKVIKDRLQQVNGVGQISIVGKQERNVWIYLDPFKLEGLNLTVQDVVSALKSQHVEFPGGRIETDAQEISVKTKAEFATIQELSQAVVAYQNGYPVTVADIGRVEDGVEEVRSVARLNDKQAVSLLIRKQSGTNTVSVAHSLKKEIDELQKELASQGIKLEIAQDQAVFIEHSIDEIQFHLVFGGLLAVFIVFVFLRNFRITLISAVAIPISVVGTFIFMRYFEFTMNTMTMLALSLSIGILIDDAIVVVENIYRHFKKSGNAEEAAKLGTAEIGLAAFAITLSIVAVFIPVAFMKGMIGRFFYQFGLTVAFSVLISLFVAFTLTPMLSAKYLRRSEDKDHFLAKIDAWYVSLLKRALNYRKTTLSVAVGLFAFTLFLGRFLNAEFIPLEDQSEFFVKVKAPLDSSVNATDQIMQDIAAHLKEYSWVRYTFATAGGGSLGKVNEGELYVKMTEKNERRLSQKEAMNIVRQKLSGMKHVSLSIEQVPRVSGNGGHKHTAIHLNINGSNLEEMERIASAIKLKFAEAGGYVDVDTSYETGKPEAEILVKRDRAAALGVTPGAIAQTVKSLVGGMDVSKYRFEGNRYNISVRLNKEFRNRFSDIYRLSVKNNNGQLVKLDNLVDVNERLGPVQINRLNRSRIISVYSNLKEGQKVLGEAVEEINQFLPQLNLPEGYSVKFSGTAEMMQEAFANLIFALVLAIVMVYMVLASQFESYSQPFVIMLSMPFSIIGAVAALVVSQMTLSIYTVIGIIMLMGLVTKNAILLVDYINTLRKRDGLGKNEAIIAASPMRLHPILMTTLAMVFGMLPIALGNGAGSESRAPMAVAIIGGLLVSMALTLVVVPVTYSLVDGVGMRLKATLRGWLASAKAKKRLRFQ